MREKRKSARLSSSSQKAQKVEDVYTRLVQIRANISILEDEECYVKKAFSDTLADYFRSMKLEKIQPEASRLYWGNRGLATVTKDAYKKAVGRPLYPDPQRFTGRCIFCHEDHEVECKSWAQAWHIENRGVGYPHCPRNSERRVEREAERKEAARVWREYLERLRTMPYPEYLQTDHWKEVRLKALKRAQFRCQLCNEAAKLDVHHRTYERRGCEEWHDLIALCRKCHGKHHDALPAPDGEVSS